MNKIITFKDLPNLIGKLKDSRRVLIGGVFDLIHLGHVRFLAQAKQHGTLLVALESDANVKHRKGKHRPFHTQTERAEMLTHIDTADYILMLPTLATHADYFNLVKAILPDVIVVTAGDAQLVNKTKQAEIVGAKIVIIPKIATPSTTQLAKLLNLE